MEKMMSNKKDGQLIIANKDADKPLNGKADVSGGKWKENSFNTLKKSPVTKITIKRKLRDEEGYSKNDWNKLLKLRVTGGIRIYKSVLNAISNYYKDSIFDIWYILLIYLIILALLISTSL
jgi:hypothetical protein